MHFLPISVAIFIVFFLVPFLIFMLPAVAFAKLGLSPFAGLAFFWFSLIGSLINIPVYRKELEYYEKPDEIAAMFNRFFGIRVPVFHQEQVIALNLGGAVLPGLLSLYLLFRINLVPAIISTAIVTAFSYYLSKPVKGVGIIIPAFIPPIIAAVAALIFAAKGNAPAVAYVSGVLGTLIGADLLRLHQMRSFGVSFLSIGGAGVFDGIFIVGIISVLLA
jgi:uncharacterized membrane protein